MGATPQQPVDQAVAALICFCGTPVTQHHGKDHPFMERWAYDPATWRRGARFEHENLNPATPLYITVEDRLRVSVFSQTVNVEVDFTGRLQRPDGQVIPIRFQMFPLSQVAVQNSDFDLAEGFLLDASILTPTAAVRVGQVFAVAQIIRGAGANALPSRTLISNYVSSGNVIGWPEGPNQQSVQGNGVPVASILGNPGAGVEFSFGIPNGKRLLIQSLSLQLTTSVTVANRVPHFQIIDPGANVLWDCAASANQAASTTVRYSLCGGIQPTIFDGSAILPIPDVGMLLQGWSIRTVTTALQVGDTYLNPNVNALQWLEP